LARRKRAEVNLVLPPKLIHVFEGEADYRISYGGRGSAKTRTFAKMTAVRAYKYAEAGRDGIILCGREYMNSLDESSMSEVKTAILSEPWLANYFDMGEKYIRTKDGRIEYKFIGLSRNLDSIKSKSKILLCWVDEADRVSESAWLKLLPTVRVADSEVWVTWNPERENSATNKRFRLDPPTNSRVQEMNYEDNPWFPDVLDRRRQDDLEKRPHSYDHIWGGGYITYVEGAYFAKALAVAKESGRIGRVGLDPLMRIRSFWDIGGTGRKADATAIWICQFIGNEIRVLDYYEAVGQTASTHVSWMQRNGYGPETTDVWLPHDGDHHEKTIDATYSSALRDVGYDVEVVPNQGRGAAMNRIDAVRRLFPSMWFNEEGTDGGRSALGLYHEKIDEDRGIGLGPDHDFTSHAADAFGLMCICHEETRVVVDMPQVEWEPV